MSYWSKLSMKDKADVMKLFLNSGISDLDTMRREYNIFAGGGDINDADLIDWIIREEGFNKKPEDIGDGKITLGSGLTDKKWHDLYKKRGNKWSAEDNRMAVAEEVANRRRWAEKNIPNWDTLPDSAQKALLSYKYNYNFTSANSPKLFQALRDSNLYEAAKQMDATSKDPKFKKGLMDRRKREQEWFLSDVTGNVPVQAIPIQVPVTVNTSMLPIIELAVSTAVRNNYVPATTTPYNRGNNMRRGFESVATYNRMMDATSIPNNPLPEYPFPISYADGGNLNYSYTKPLNNVFLDDEGNLLDPEVPSAKGTIRTPEVIVTARDPRKAIPTANGLNIPDVSLELRRRFYDHITPAGYEFPITRTVAAVLNPGRVKTIEVNPQTRRGKTIYPGLITALRDDLFAEYLQIPKEERHKVIINAENNAYNSGELEETSLRPTNAENDKYFKFKNLSNLEKDRLVKLGTPLSVGSNTLSGALRAYLGEHTIGHGHDTKGDYVSYYDNWDLAPFTGKGKDQSLGIGKPVHIYDRIYLDDYYDTPEEYRGSTYIPELTVTANKHADGGKIHINPSKKGTFTAAASRHGMGVQEFASKVLANKENYSPAMVKKANFARNASKWHGLGGNLFEIGGDKNSYDAPQTFAGRVAHVAGASPRAVRDADVVSSVLQMTPYGYTTAALDLGRDMNRVYHGEEGAWKDAGLDILGMIPGVSKLGMKKIKPKTWIGKMKQGYDELLQPAREGVNSAINVLKALDFTDDTWGANKTSDAKQAKRKKY